jgi:hypothetical protein
MTIIMIKIKLLDTNNNTNRYPEIREGNPE